MNDQIFEVVITTVNHVGTPHVAPMGIRYLDDAVVLMPFRPSTTHDNILQTGRAVLNIVSDTRVFAGCVTGRKNWPLARIGPAGDMRLEAAMRHMALQLARNEDNPQRPVLHMAVVDDVTHARCAGFNRAQAAVIEAAVLVSRLHMLPRDKVEREMAYLQIAIDKTAGPHEHEAWQWLTEAVGQHPAHEERAP